jgi:hypothetical protein
MIKIVQYQHKKPFMKIIRAGLVIIVGSVLLLGCAQKPRNVGTLEGHVTIGPLTPVVRVGEPTPTPNPDVYAARKIIVYKADGKTVFTEVNIDSQGNYKEELPVGTYVVDINHTGIDRAAGFPMQIKIAADAVTTIDINIDTGIR